MRLLSSLKTFLLCLAVLGPAAIFSFPLKSQEDPGLFSNEEVATRFQSYLKSGKACTSVTRGPRAIIAGFAQLRHLPFNYSGFVLANLASEKFWPADKAEPVVPTEADLPLGHLQKLEDVRFVNRSFRMPNGQDLSVCLITTAVLWDYAAAVIANEMTRFQPQAVILTGIDDQAYLEAGAVRDSDSLPGYFSDGSVDPANRELSPWVLPDPDLPEALPMTWDRRDLAQRVGPLFAKLKTSLDIPDGPRLHNNYICNEESYVALAAALNKSLTLAGGEIVLHPRVETHPRIGFFHFPSLTLTDGATLASYAKIVMELVEGSLVVDQVKR